MLQPSKPPKTGHMQPAIACVTFDKKKKEIQKIKFMNAVSLTAVLFPAQCDCS